MRVLANYTHTRSVPGAIYNSSGLPGAYFILVIASSQLAAGSTEQTRLGVVKAVWSVAAASGGFRLSHEPVNFQCKKPQQEQGALFICLGALVVQVESDRRLDTKHMNFIYFR
jgi:hypothetical protein